MPWRPLAYDDIRDVNLSTCGIDVQYLIILVGQGLLPHEPVIPRDICAHVIIILTAAQICQQSSLYHVGNGMTTPSGHPLVWKISKYFNMVGTNCFPSVIRPKLRMEHISFMYPVRKIAVFTDAIKQSLAPRARNGKNSPEVCTHRREFAELLGMLRQSGQ